MDQFSDSWYCYQFRYCSVNNLGKIKNVSVGAVICSRETGELNKKIAQKPPKSRTVIREKSEQKFAEAPETAYMTEKSMIKLKKAS